MTEKGVYMSGVCNRRCFQCKYKDCINDEISLTEGRMGDKRDRKIIKERQIAAGEIVPFSEKKKAARRKYYAANREKLRESSRRYYRENQK